MIDLKNKMNLYSVITMSLGGLFLLFFPSFGGPFYMHIFIILFLNVVLATSYRPLYVTGLGSFCHVTFYGIGAYTSALLAVKLGMPFGVCFLAAGIMPAIVAVLVGWVSARSRGPYFFLISFAFWAVMDSVFRHWGSMTGGPGGLKDIPPLMGLETVTPYYYVVMLLAVLVVFILYRLDKSRFGAELLAIGDADDLAEVVGIDVVRHRVLAFAIGALFAGFAGSIYAHYMRFISPSAFSMFFTLYILIWCVMGGERKLWGPIAGATFLTLVAEFLRMSGPRQAILYSAALLAVVMLMPHGFVGLVDDLRTKRGTSESSAKNTKLPTVE